MSHSSTAPHSPHLTCEESQLSCQEAKITTIPPTQWWWNPTHWWRNLSMCGHRATSLELQMTGNIPQDGQSLPLVDEHRSLTLKDTARVDISQDTHRRINISPNNSCSGLLCCLGLAAAYPSLWRSFILHFGVESSYTLTRFHPAIRLRSTLHDDATSDLLRVKPPERFFLELLVRAVLHRRTDIIHKLDREMLIVDRAQCINHHLLRLK